MPRARPPPRSPQTCGSSRSRRQSLSPRHHGTRRSSTPGCTAQARARAGNAIQPRVPDRWKSPWLVLDQRNVLEPSLDRTKRLGDLRRAHAAAPDHIQCRTQQPVLHYVRRELVERDLDRGNDSQTDPKLIGDADATPNGIERILGWPIALKRATPKRPRSQSTEGRSDRVHYSIGLGLLRLLVAPRKRCRSRTDKEQRSRKPDLGPDQDRSSVHRKRTNRRARADVEDALKGGRANQDVPHIRERLALTALSRTARDHRCSRSVSVPDITGRVLLIFGGGISAAESERSSNARKRSG